MTSVTQIGPHILDRSGNVRLGDDLQVMFTYYVPEAFARWRGAADDLARRRNNVNRGPGRRPGARASSHAWMVRIPPISFTDPWCLPRPARN